MNDLAIIEESALETLIERLPIPREEIAALESAYKAHAPQVVHDESSCAVTDAALADIKKNQKWVKLEREKLTKPIGKLEDAARDAFRKLDEYLSIAEADCKRAILNYKREVQARLEAQRRELQEAENRAAEAQRAALEDKAVEAEIEGRAADAGMLTIRANSVRPAVVGVPVLKHGGKSSMRKVRKWRLTGEAIDPAYLVLDEARINRECKAGLNPPAGIEYFDDLELSARSA